MVVIASIHQPSTNTLLLFNNVLLLSGGQTVYYGPPVTSMRYFTSLGYPPPPMLSPAEFMLELTNTDFDKRNSLSFRIETLFEAWNGSLECTLLHDKLIMNIDALKNANAQIKVVEEVEKVDTTVKRGTSTRNFFMQSVTLFHRMIIVSPLLPLLAVIDVAEIVQGSSCLRS